MKLIGVARTALKIYTMHILVWTVGVVCGVVETFMVLLSLGWGPR